VGKAAGLPEESERGGIVAASPPEDWMPKGRPTYGDLCAQRNNRDNGIITEAEYQRRIEILQARMRAAEPSEAPAEGHPEEREASLVSAKAPPIVPLAAPRKHSTYDEAFEEFWATYPKRDGANPKKPAADKLTRILKSGVPPAAILTGAKRYRAECVEKNIVGTPYVAQAITWLNQERWGDYQQRLSFEQLERAPLP
jgi:hypothetical protein